MLNCHPSRARNRETLLFAFTTFTVFFVIVWKTVLYSYFITFIQGSTTQTPPKAQKNQQTPSKTSPKITQKMSELFQKTWEISRKTWEIFWKSSHVFSVLSEFLREDSKISQHHHENPSQQTRHRPQVCLENYCHSYMNQPFTHHCE